MMTSISRFAVLLFAVAVFSPVYYGTIKTGADQPDKYLPYLKGKRVAILANPTSIVGKKHLVDFLLENGVKVVKVFGPEHGFRGNASAGTEVSDEKDSARDRYLR